jgi:hypothetical protein
MAGQIIHYNVTMPERMFPIMQIGKGRQTKCDIPQFDYGGVGNVRGLSAERARPIRRPGGEGS